MDIEAGEIQHPYKGIDTSRDLTSPYYLHPGENPGTTLVTPPLNGKNYHSWSRSMRKALSSKNKFICVDGGIQVPQQSDPTFDSWERCNIMVISWITRSLTQSIAQSTVYIDNAQELWEDLKERFSRGDHFRMSDLLQEIHSIKQGERDISAFHTDIKTLWEELDDLRALPTCANSSHRAITNYQQGFLNGLAARKTT
ncbi:PREDICTED: uncharacterized protein LOC109353971 [Lupinus angustifolius]|uniref:uncharacterized protein LOC109353971 n=1 Tax=Lupinus angustifolius TaxID=3871 RepID=UPI00092E4288|nr:PREDICTED: uncharacterized protein LOC109353971 [Lupinus angustifolius]